MTARHATAGALAAAVGLLCCPAAGWATTPTAVLPITAQAQQANATFLAYAPPPAAGAGALCLVDTGVDQNPDTTAGLIGSYAIDNGASADVDPGGHGTSMAMIAGGTGKGVLGAWPALKIVSVRATNVPSPGQEPIYEFDDYTDALQYCSHAPVADDVKVVDLALASPIPPSPDQAAAFANAVTALEASNVAVVAAAGNSPGAVEEPGAEPNVFAVGADTAQPASLSDTPMGAVCSFSADQGIALYAPGCGLDGSDPFSDQPFCCENGTSQASAFTAAVIVAMMSYDPTLPYAKAEDLLTQTADDGDLDVAAAFQAAGLGQIVSEGNANTPPPPAAPTTTPPTTTPPTTTSAPPTATSTAKTKAGVSVESITWKRGILTIQLAGMRKHDTARITLTYRHGRPHKTKSGRATITLRTRRPRSVEVRVFHGRRPVSPSDTVKL